MLYTRNELLRGKSILQTAMHVCSGFYVYRMFTCTGLHYTYAWRTGLQDAHTSVDPVNSITQLHVLRPICVLTEKFMTLKIRNRMTLSVYQDSYCDVFRVTDFMVDSHADHGFDLATNKG